MENQKKYERLNNKVFVPQAREPDEKYFQLQEYKEAKQAQKAARDLYFDSIGLRNQAPTG